MGVWLDRNTKMGYYTKPLGLAYVEQKKKKKRVSDNANFSLAVGCAIKNYRYLKVNKIHIINSLHDLLDLRSSV